jgi:membrane protein
MNTKIINKIEIIYHKIRSSVIYYIKGLYHRIDDDNAFLMGGGLTFSFVTCIIPFILILFSVLGKLLEVPELENQINTFIEKIIPYKESAGFVKSIVHARITEFRQFRTLAGYLGALGLFFAASGLVSSLRTILNSIFGIDKGKNVFIAKLRDFGIILLVVIIFLLSIGFISLIEVIRNLAGKIWFLNILNFGFLKYFLLPFLSFLIMLGIFYFIYYVIPYKKIEKPILLVSAFWAAFLWEIAKQLFSLYLAYSANLSKIYGAYVFIVVVVFWLYYSSIVIIIGAEIGQLYSERIKLNQSKYKS